jgi:copper chaperone CopZ
MKYVNIAIEGMHSQACVKAVRTALEQVEGLRVGEVALGLATIYGDAKQQAAALEAIENAGYQPHISV